MQWASEKGPSSPFLEARSMATGLITRTFHPPVIWGILLRGIYSFDVILVKSMFVYFFRFSMFNAGVAKGDKL
jgi:hypothetical protein